MAALRANMRSASPRSDDGFDRGLALAADTMTEPRVSQVGASFAVIVNFFDGDGSAALAHSRAASAAKNGRDKAALKVPAVVVLIRRPDGSSMTDVVMSRLDDATAVLNSWSQPLNRAALPAALRSPVGSELLADLADFGSSHNSRTIIASGMLSTTAWADKREALLSRDGFSVERPPVGRQGAIALHGRRGSAETDVLYTPGDKPGEVIEVIEIRQPLAEGNMP